MRDAVTNLPRFIVTSKIVKHRLFTWVNSQIISDCQLYCVARADDYFFGVLHSRAHELWALRMGTSLEDRPRYMPTTMFETFHFPWSPGQEPKDDPKVKAIAEATRAPAQKRDAWLNPAGATAAELVGRPAQDARRRRVGGLRLACLADRSGDVGEAAGAERGAGGNPFGGTYPATSRCPSRNGKGG